MKIFKKIRVLIFFCIVMLSCTSSIYAHDDKYCSMDVPDNYKIFGEDEGFLMAAKMPTEEDLVGRMISYRAFPDLKLTTTGQLENFLKTLNQEGRYTNISFTTVSNYDAIYFEQVETEGLLAYYAILSDNNTILFSLGSTVSKEDLQNEDFKQLLASLVLKDTTDNVDISNIDLQELQNNVSNDISENNTNNSTNIIITGSIVIISLIVLALLIGFIIYSVRKNKQKN